MAELTFVHAQAVIVSPAQHIFVRMWIIAADQRDQVIDWDHLAAKPLLLILSFHQHGAQKVFFRHIVFCRFVSFLTHQKRHIIIFCFVDFDLVLVALDQTLAKIIRLLCLISNLTQRNDRVLSLSRSTVMGAPLEM